MDWNARLSAYYTSLARQQRLPYLEVRREQLRQRLLESLKQRQNKSLDEEAYEESKKLGEELDIPEVRFQSIIKRRVGTEFHGFLSLPREIRDMVYRELVAPGLRVPFYRDEQITRNGRGRQYARYASLDEDLEPFLAVPLGFSAEHPFGLIRGVSKQVHLEAMRVYFRENRFVFPAGGGCPDGGRLCAAFWDGDNRSFGHDQLAPALRDVSYAFDMRDWPISDFHALSDCAEFNTIDLTRPSSKEQRLEQLHEYKVDLVKSVWHSRIRFMRKMNLDRLQLAFDEAYCGLGCCRMVEWLCNLLSSADDDVEAGNDPSYVGPPRPNEWGGIEYDSHQGEVENTVTLVPCPGPRAPRVIEVFGWRDDEEKLMIENKLTLLKPIGTEQIRFLGQSLAEEHAASDDEWEM